MPSKHGKGHRARWTDEHGKRRSCAFKLKRDAERFEIQKKAEAERIRRGLQLGNAPNHTFGELADYWIAHRAARKRSQKDDESIIRKHLRPAFGTMLVREVGVEDVDEYVMAREHLSPKTLANHVTLLGSMLRLAASFKVPWLVHVPRLNKPKVALFSHDYAYLRNDDEVRRFLSAAEAHGPSTFALYATAVYTGLRAGELAGLEWADVDLDRRQITVQRSFDGLTKSGRVRYVPILDPLLPILRSWRLRSGVGLVFPNRADAMHGPSARIFQESFHEVLAMAGFRKAMRAGKLRPYIRFHDLRHSFASMWVAKSGDLFRLQKILGHQTITMTQRYAHLAPHLFAEDYGRFPVLVREAAEVVSLADHRARSAAAKRAADLAVGHGPVAT